MIITLSWPHKLLWPNGSRGTVYGVSGAKKKYRLDAEWATIIARQAGEFDHAGGEIPVKLIVRAKPRGPLPDKDNVIAAVKVGLDGIAAQIGVNDRNFAAPLVEFAEPRNGTIEVCLG